MYEFWYDYVKPKYDGKVKSYYLDTDIESIKTLCKNRWYLQSIAEEVETGFNTSNYELSRQLHKRKNKKVIGIRRKNHDKIC